MIHVVSTGLTRILAPPLVVLVSSMTCTLAQTAPPSGETSTKPTNRTAKATNHNQQDGPNHQHPLVPLLEMANDGLEKLRAIRGYSATLVKRERIDDKLSVAQYIFVKIRHEQKHDARVVVPFSVYLYFLRPEDIRGREVLYVRGRNSGKLLAHEGGEILGLVSAWLDPQGRLAMMDNRYPITEIGILNLTERLIEAGEQGLNYNECEVKLFDGAKINGRPCKCIQVVHPHRRAHFRFHKAQIFIDKELNVPVRYASWLWPEKPGGEPVLLEEYAYLNLKINDGFTDADFSPDNPAYRFQ